MMGRIGAILPGLYDPDRLLQAHGVVRKAGLTGLAALCSSLIAYKAGWRSDHVAIVLCLSLGWTLAMVGATILFDARGGVLRAGRLPGAIVALVTGYALIGVTALIAGVAIDGWIAFGVVMAAVAN